MKKLLLIPVFLAVPGVVAGSGQSGGTPPAREQLESQLLAAQIGSAALFDKGLGDFGLLTNRELLPQMTLSKSVRSATDLSVSEADFDLLRDRKLPIDSVGSSGENNSYRISDGDQMDSLTLTDRRSSVRAGKIQ